MMRAMPSRTSRRAGRPQRRPVLLLSLRGYRRGWAAADAAAALTLLVIAIPEQLATSRLAGMPPLTGYYAFIAGTVLFALLGSHPQMSVGADSTIAPLFAAAIGRLAPIGGGRYAELVALTAVVVGVLVALVWLLRLGWVSEFLSAPIIAGFLAGVAVIILVHQLPALLGLPAASGGTVNRLDAVLGHLGQVNGWTLAIGVAVLLIVAVAERIDRRAPGALIGLVASTIAVAVLGLTEKGVAVLGTVPDGAPHLGLRGLSVSAIGDVTPVAAVVALVVVSQSAATARAFRRRDGYDADVGRDFLGVGAGSIAAGLLGAFPVDASPPRTAAVAAASGRTQAAGLGAAAAIALLIPAAGLLRDVPLAALGGVLVFIAARLFRVGELAAIARFNRFEFALALITLLTVALVGVEQGIAVAVLLAILDRTRLSARPQLHVLGRLAHTTSWAPLSSAERPAQIPGVLVVLFATPLWYANADNFRAELHAAMGRALGTPELVVLDAIGMSDIDYTGSLALRAVLDELDGRRIRFAVARAGGHVRASLERSGLLDRIGRENLFPAVDEAVTALAPVARTAGEREPGSHDPPPSGESRT